MPWVRGGSVLGSLWQALAQAKPMPAAFAAAPGWCATEPSGLYVAPHAGVVHCTQNNIVRPVTDHSSLRRPRVQARRGDRGPGACARLGCDLEAGIGIRESKHGIDILRRAEDHAFLSAQPHVRPCLSKVTAAQDALSM